MYIYIYIYIYIHMVINIIVMNTPNHAHTCMSMGHNTNLCMYVHTYVCIYLHEPNIHKSTRTLKPYSPCKNVPYKRAYPDVAATWTLDETVMSVRLPTVGP